MKHVAREEGEEVGYWVPQAVQTRRSSEGVAMVGFFFWR